jgi:hypothetical protein
MINNLILKVSLSDGCSVAQDILTIICPTSTPTPTITATPTNTPTPTPTATPLPINQVSYFLNQTNNYTYTVGGNVVAKFATTNTDVSSVNIKLPIVQTSSPNILTPISIIYQNTVIGQLQIDPSRIFLGTNVDISFALSNTVYQYTNIALTAPAINLS